MPPLGRPELSQDKLRSFHQVRSGTLDCGAGAGAGERAERSHRSSLPLVTSEDAKSPPGLELELVPGIAIKAPERPPGGVRSFPRTSCGAFTRYGAEPWIAELVLELVKERSGAERMTYFILFFPAFGATIGANYIASHQPQDVKGEVRRMRSTLDTLGGWLLCAEWMVARKQKEKNLLLVNWR